MKISRIICGAYAENAYYVDDRLLIDPGDGYAALARETRDVDIEIELKTCDGYAALARETRDVDIEKELKTCDGCAALAGEARDVDIETKLKTCDGCAALAREAHALDAILLTHGHFDHTLSAARLSRERGAEIYVSRLDAPMLSDAALALYDPGACGAAFATPDAYKCYSDGIFGFSVIETPGHTPGSVCLYSASEGVLFSGDTLFRAGFGRTDFPGGSMSDLRNSLKKLLDLPADVRVFPGHGGETTIGEERRRYHR